jgi:predicted MFS family arabinose efflux permease
MLCGATHNLAASGPGSLIGALLAGRVADRIGFGPTIAHMQVLTGVARLCIPLAAVSGVTLPVLIVGEFLLGVARPIFNINQLSLRQAVTPDHLQGRMNASIRFLMWGAVPLGALAGGIAAERLGILPVLVLAGLVTTAASLWIYRSPVWRLRRPPTAPAVPD